MEARTTSVLLGRVAGACLAAATLLGGCAVDGAAAPESEGDAQAWGYKHHVDCTNSYGYWKTHNRDAKRPRNIPWPTTPATEPFAEDQLLCGYTWLDIMEGLPGPVTPFEQIARQYIAAQLNIAGGAGIPGAVQSALDDAEDILDDCYVSGGELASGLYAAFILDRYNNDKFGKDVCKDRCGDGDLDPGEACDDGNNEDGDGCSSECELEQTEPECGDGIVEGDEECDDGNDVNDDFCTNDCEEARCGDGIVQEVLGEECDDGDRYSGDGCSKYCTIEPFCGDGELDPGEACDDGNNVDGDGCSSECELEQTEPECGDGVVEGDEECDDGNNRSGDGCNKYCELEFCGDGIRQYKLGEECDDGNDVNDDHCTNDCEKARCGDGIVQAVRGETCDDGNTVDGDGCSSECELEQVEPKPKCGNGVVEGWEECDDGNRYSGDGCSKYCKIEPFCGDGELDPGEACDDGNNDDGDGCSSECELEQTEPECGDGIVEGDEECDDGNNRSGDGCNKYCELEFCGDGIRQYKLDEECDDGNDVNDDFCTNDCEKARCGDGIVQAVLGETCDDGNRVDGDGCSSECELEQVEPKPKCGNGIVEGWEECDDGNRYSGDGCSKYCKLEAVCGNGVIEPGESCDDGNTVDGDGCSSECELELIDCPEDLGLAALFNVFVFDDFIDAPDVEGRLAAGDLVDMSGFSIAREDQGGLVPALVGGRLVLENGTIYGDAYYDISEDLDNVTFLAGGELLNGAPIDFVEEEFELTNISLSLAGFATNGTTQVQRFGPIAIIELEGDDTDLNVFTLDVDDLNDAASLTIDVPAGSTVLVNVVGTDTVDASNFQIFLDGPTASQILWNFPETTLIELESIAWRGSVLAPFADVEFDNGNFVGTLIAVSATGTAQYDLALFEGDLCPDDNGF